MASCVVLGDALVDEVEVDGQVRRAAGGCALNVAVTLGRVAEALGSRGRPDIALVTNLGPDAEGALLREVLTAAGVTAYVPAEPLPTRVARAHRRGVDMTYDFSDAKVRREELTPPVLDAVAGADIVVVSTSALADPAERDVLLATLRRARGLRLIDPNPRIPAGGDGSGIRAHLEQLAPRASLLKVSSDDVRALYPGAPDAAAGRLRGLGADAVLVTRSGAGAAVHTDAGMVEHPGVPLPGRLADTIGAGDSALAGLVAGLLRSGWPEDLPGWRDVLDLSMTVAAVTCTATGGLPDPDLLRVMLRGRG